MAEFEGLRGLMAWWVVLGHMSQFAGYEGTQGNLPWYQYVLLRGAVPVEVFITLSGFVIYALLSKSKNFAYGPYLMGRFFRLYPAYLVAFISALLALPLVSIAVTSSWADPQALAEKLARLSSTQQNLPEHIFLHLSLLHGLVADQWLPYAGDAILGPAWSLSLEWQFYLVVPLFFALSLRSFPAWAVMCTAVLLGKLWLSTSGYTFSYGAFLPIHFEFFVLGMGSFIVWRRVVAGVALWAAIGPLLAGLVVAYSVMAVRGGMREHFYPLAIWMVVFTAALYRVVSGKVTLVSNVLCHPSIQYIGRISYSTYIVHVVAITVVGAAMVHFTEGHLISRGTALAVMFVVGTPVIFLISVLLNRWVENPGVILGRRLSNRIWAVYARAKI